MTANTVYIVHCIDTEGPLYESLDAKFGRLDDLFGINNIAPTRENWLKLQRGEIALGGGLEKKVQEVFSSHLGSFNGTWSEVDAMLDRVRAAKFRDAMPDSNGNGWLYNWFCLDHINYLNNPRRRDIGFHNIFDHYRELIAGDAATRDAIHWHFHPMSTYRDAHRCATHYLRSDEIYQILARRIIERDWFPSVFRAGFQAERPDSHWFLEQWIPFDITNMALDDPSEFDKTIDFRNGRSGDWRLAPSDWSIYHPSHDNYQLPGNCRRWIARALNVLNRIASIDQREMDKAFARAATGQPTIVGICSHDFRDLGTEVDFLRSLIAGSRQKYPDVRFEFAEASHAFRQVAYTNGITEAPLELSMKLQPATDGDVAYLEIVAEKGQVFGPQPFLALETGSHRFIHDNLDFSTDGRRWFYAFHGDTLPVADVLRAGVAAADKYGNVSVCKLDLQGRTAN